MSTNVKFYCLDPGCGWSGPIPNKGGVCKRCNGPTEKRADNYEEIPNGNSLGKRMMINDPIPICPYTNLPFQDIAVDNPTIRKYKTANGDLHFGLIFRNRGRVVQINCPNCGKLISTNAKIEGQYEIICKNMMSADRGGGKCRARVTVIFYREQFKEINRDKEKVEPPPIIRHGGQDSVQSALQRDRISVRR